MCIDSAMKRSKLLYARNYCVHALIRPEEVKPSPAKDVGLSLEATELGEEIKTTASTKY